MMMLLLLVVVEEEWNGSTSRAESRPVDDEWYDNGGDELSG